MTIKNYTFFSPSGTEFPISANADAKLYLMLSGMTLLDYKRTDWLEPVDTALNRKYTNTSIVAGGRYFELVEETVTLNPSTTNYVHANIDLANTLIPVNLSVEAADHSNGNDINTGSGVLKKLIDIITTDGTRVISSEMPKQNFTIGNIKAADVSVSKITSLDDTAPAFINGNGAPSGRIVYERKNGIVFVSGSGNWGPTTTSQSKLVATLPPGFRPSVSRQIGANAQGGSQENAWVIETNGEVKLTPNPGGNSLYSGWTVSYPQGN